MASANVLSELTAQLNNKEQIKSGESDENNSSDGNSKHSSNLRPKNYSKTNADEIISTENKLGKSERNSSAQNNKKNQKPSFFRRVKQFIKRPSSKHQGHSEKHERVLHGKQRTQSASHLDCENAPEEDENRRLSLRSDSQSGISETQESDQKHKRESHGVAKIFGRVKLRSSWKSKFKVSRNDNEKGSDPVSPAEQQTRKKVQQLNLQIDGVKDDVNEDIATINTVFADDSFFQVSLVEDEEIKKTELDQSFILNDVSMIDETIPSSRTSAAQDKIRLAPRGRRRPTRFNSQGSMVSKVSEKSEIVDALQKQNEIQTIADVIETKKYKTTKPLNINESDIQESLNGIEFGNTVIINTPDSEILFDKSKHQVSADNEFGSFEHLSKAKSDSSLKTDNISQSGSPSGSSINNERNGITSSLSDNESKSKKGSLRADEIQVDPNISNSNEPVGFEIKEIENLGSQFDATSESETNEKEHILSNNLEDKNMEEYNLNKKDDGVSNENVNIHEERNLEKDKVVPDKQKQQIDLTDERKKGNDVDNNTLQTVFDAIISRTKSIEEELSKADEEIPGSRKETVFNEKQEVYTKRTVSDGKNISFDMNDLDDIRSTDLQPSSSFQRSYSLSAAANPIGTKNISVPASVEKTSKTSSNDTDIHQTKPSVPDWVAIAKAKHRRNTFDDENESEEGETKNDDNAKSQQPEVLKQQHSPVREQPFVEKKQVLSKIPKPAFKSQSFKETRTSQPVSKLPSRSAKSVKVSSPVSTCIVCDKPAYQHERCDIDGQVAHKNCAKCSMCSRTMNVGTIQVASGKLYCGIHIRHAAR